MLKRKRWIVLKYLLNLQEFYAVIIFIYGRNNCNTFVLFMKDFIIHFSEVTTVQVNLA